MAMCNQWVFLCFAAIRKGPPKNTAFLQAQTALFIPVHVILFSTIDLFFFEFVRLHPVVISGNNWLYCNWYLILWQQSLVITSYIYCMYTHSWGILFGNFCRNYIPAQELPNSKIFAENRKKCRQFSILPK